MPQKLAITRLSNVDIRLLQIFQTVAVCGGFTAAEFELNIGRSTISKHISDLETRLNLKLCHRGPGGFSLTSDGQHVLKSAEELFASIEVFQDRVAEVRSDMAGKLKIATFDRSSSNPDAFVYDAIRTFHQRAPGVTLDISIEPPNVIEEGVINGRFNLGIVPLHRESPMLSYSVLYNENMRLYCGREHPLFARAQEEIELTELRDFEYAGLSFNSVNMAVHQKLKLRKSAFVQNEEALALLVLSGCFLGFLPIHTAQSLIASGALRQVKCDAVNFSSNMASIVKKSASKGRRLRVFLECLAMSHSGARQRCAPIETMRAEPVPIS